MVSQKNKILLVEDDKDLLPMYKEYLEDEGYILTIAKDGNRGITEIKKGGFDIILLDIMMPNTDGLQVLQSLTPTDKAKNGPIIMLSQLNDEPVMKKALRYGASGYIIKSSLGLPDLLHEVRVYLNKDQTK